MQAQVVTQAGGQYTVQPATAAQGAVQHLKTAYGTGQPLTTYANPAASAVAQHAQPQVGSMGQVLVQGPGGVMYAAAPAGGGIGDVGAQQQQQQQPAQGPQYAPAMQASYGGGMGGGQLVQGGGVGGPVGVQGGTGSQYQVAPSGGMQLSSNPVVQTQAADPVAYAKLAGYGQQGAVAQHACLLAPPAAAFVHVGATTGPRRFNV